MSSRASSLNRAATNEAPATMLTIQELEPQPRASRAHTSIRLRASASSPPNRRGTARRKNPPALSASTISPVSLPVRSVSSARARSSGTSSPARISSAALSSVEITQYHPAPARQGRSV
jgi:hypothetical protein